MVEYIERFLLVSLDIVTSVVNLGLRSTLSLASARRPKSMAKANAAPIFKDNTYNFYNYTPFLPNGHTMDTTFLLRPGAMTGVTGF